MKRTKRIVRVSPHVPLESIKHADALLVGDWHLREDVPVCRTDDFETAQWEKVKWISELQKQFNCLVLHSGDLFNHWKPSPALLAKAIEFLPDNFYTCFGNHDLPQHNLDLAYKCGINVLEKAGKIQLLNNGHWNQSIPDPKDVGLILGKRIFVWHVMTYEGNPPWPGCTDTPFNKILDKYSDQFDLIVTGHNHKMFYGEKNGSWLVNPGSLTRQKADQVDHIPTVFLWAAEDNLVYPIEIPYARNVISREHIDKIEERDSRIQAFVERLSTEFGIGLSFEDNLERFEKENSIRSTVMEIIYRAIEKGREK
jgi:predicted phosphodiesterase